MRKLILGLRLQRSARRSPISHAGPISTPDQENMLARLEASLKWHHAQTEERAARRAQAAAQAEAWALEPREDHLEDFMARLDAVVKRREQAEGPSPHRETWVG